MSAISKIDDDGLGAQTRPAILEWLRNYWRGNVSKRALLVFCVPPGLLVLAVGNALSIGLFPGVYDWRYQVMCSLASPIKNPAGHVYWSLGLILSILIGVPISGYFGRWFSPWSPRIARFSETALKIGFAAGILVGLEASFFPNFGGTIPKAHEITAIIAFIGCYFGVAGFWCCLTLWLLKVQRRPMWFGAGVFLLHSIPLTGAMLSQAFLFFDPNRPGWVSREWISLGIPLVLSFAFWEWLAAFALVLCICTLVWVLPPKTAFEDDSRSFRPHRAV